MDHRTVHSSIGYINEGGGANTNCFFWRNNLRCTVLESSARGGGLVYVEEKKGWHGNDKAQVSAGDRCDNDEDIRKEYAA